MGMGLSLSLGEFCPLPGSGAVLRPSGGRILPTEQGGGPDRGVIIFILGITVVRAIFNAKKRPNSRLLWTIYLKILLFSLKHCQNSG